MRIQFSIETVKKHSLKIGAIGAIAISTLLINVRLLTFSYLDSVQFFHFLLLIVACAGAYVVYMAYTKPWIFIVTTTAALFNYFFLYVLVGKTGIYVTNIALILVIVWNVLLDINSSTKPRIQSNQEGQQ